MVTTQLATVAPLIEVHDPELERKIDAVEERPSDCRVCYTGQTETCPCGGRIHNEMRKRLVHCCFSCGDGWR